MDQGLIRFYLALVSHFADNDLCRYIIGTDKNLLELIDYRSHKMYKKSISAAFVVCACCLAGCVLQPHLKDID